MVRAPVSLALVVVSLVAPIGRAQAQDHQPTAASTTQPFRAEFVPVRDAIWRGWFDNDRRRLSALLPEDVIAINNGDTAWQDRGAIVASAVSLTASPRREDLMPILGKPKVILVSLCLVACGASNATSPSPLSVAGTYATGVTMLADSCTGTVIRDNPTIVQQQPGDTTMSLTHAVIAAAGSVHNNGSFQMAPVTVPIAGVNYHVDIGGQFELRGFIATVHVGVGDLDQPTRCGYTVRWIGNKEGAPNVIPGA